MKFRSLLLSTALVSLFGAQTAFAEDLPTMKSPVDTLLPDGPLTWKGITLYGVIDVGAQWASHGLPFSGPDAAPYSIVTRSGDKALWLPSPNNVQPSTIGLKGDIPITDNGWRAVFNLASSFDPMTGQIFDTLAAMVQQNGATFARSNFADSSRAGQAFNAAAYVGVAHETYGQLVFGRVTAITDDNVKKYDPAGAAYAYSLIGIVGGTAGGGNTQNARLDQTLKYNLQAGPMHIAALYKFADAYNNYGYQFNIGGNWNNLDVDATFSQINGSVSSTFLNASQMTLATQTLNNNKTTSIPGVWGNTIAGTISDNSTIQLAAKYKWDRLTLYGGYQWTQFADPKTSIPSGYATIGGYILSTVNNANFFYHDRILQVYWTGAKYAITSNLDLIGGYYRYNQNSFGQNYCNNTSSPKCSGQLNFVSTYLDYRFNKHLDIYGGVAYSSAANGLAPAPYLYRTLWAPSAGLRYSF